MYVHDVYTHTYIHHIYIHIQAKPKYTSTQIIIIKKNLPIQKTLAVFTFIYDSIQIPYGHCPSTLAVAPVALIEPCTTIVTHPYKVESIVYSPELMRVYFVLTFVCLCS